MEKAIYEQIKEAVGEDGVLSADFRLPDEQTDVRVRFVPGAMDGICMFHTQISSDTESEGYQMLIQAVTAAAEGDSGKALAQICEFAGKDHMLAHIDDLQQYIINHREKLNPEPIYHLAAQLVTEGTQIEAVKCGLSLLELFGEQATEALKPCIRTLALSDEFTLFCAYLMRGWENGNEELFEAVKKVRGWGRVFIINSMLKADTEEIEHWLLLNGVHNEILSNYSAIDVYLNTHLLERLHKPMTLEEYRGAADILDALLDDEPEPGIAAVGDAANLLDVFMQKNIAMTGLEARDYAVIHRILQYAQSEWGEDSPVYQQAAAILDCSRTHKLMEAALAKGEMIELARKLGYAYQEPAFQSLEDDMDKNFANASLLLMDHYRPDEVIDLIAKKFSVHTIGTGSADEVGLGKEFDRHRKLSYLIQFLKEYPGKGIDIIKAALHSPVVNNRTIAIRVIEEWCKNAEKPLQEAFPELYQYVQESIPNEVREDVRKMMEEL